MNSVEFPTSPLNSLRLSHSGGQSRRGRVRLAELVLAGIGAAIAAFAGSPEAEAFAWKKGPYLQALGPDAVTVKVELSEPLALVLEVETRDTGTRRVESLEPKLFHAIRVGDLKPATTYRYRVRAGEQNKQVSEDGRFTTAPLPSEARPFRFILYGDSRSDHSAHAAVVRDIEAQPSDFLVHTGDMVHTGSSEEEWQTFFGIEGALLRDRCAFAAVGNHELKGVDPQGVPPFLRYFAQALPDGVERTSLYGSMRWSNTRFFFLNAMDTWTGEDRRWLESELSKSDEEPGLLHRIAVLHHGPFSSGKHGGNTKIASTGALSVLAAHGVDLLLSGHDHAYERGEGKGIKYIVSGGAGAPLYARKSTLPETQAFASVHHFVEIFVDGEVVKTIAHRAGGAVLESCWFKGKGKWQCGNETESAQDELVRGAALSSAPPASLSCNCALFGQASSRDASGAFFSGILLMAAQLSRRAFAKKAKRLQTGLASRDNWAIPCARMRRLSYLIPAIFLCVFGAATCATYKQDLDRARGHYEGSSLETARKDYDENQYEKALALLRVLEHDIDSYSQGEQAQYAYIRGMTDYRLSQSSRLVGGTASERSVVANPKQAYRTNARHWLGVAAAIEKNTPGGLTTEEKQRLTDAMTDLNKDVYGGAEELPAGAADAGADAAAAAAEPAAAPAAAPAK